jgi:hypothetical protein
MPRDVRDEMLDQTSRIPGIAIHTECPHRVPTHRISNKFVGTRAGVFIVRIEYGKVIGNVR